MNRRRYLSTGAALATGLSAGCSDRLVESALSTGPPDAVGSPEELPGRMATPYDVMYPDVEFDYEHDPRTGEFTIVHEGGVEITPENTGWVALYSNPLPETVEEEDRPPVFRQAWHVAGGDDGFPGTEGERVTVGGVDIDHHVELEWSEVGGKLRNWERWRLFTDYLSLGSFEVAYDRSTRELTFGRAPDEEPLYGHGGYSVTYTVDRDYETETVLASPNGGPWSFPIVPGSEIRVPTDGLAEGAFVRVWWVGPNGMRHPQQGYSVGG